MTNEAEQCYITLLYNTVIRSVRNARNTFNIGAHTHCRKKGISRKGISFGVAEDHSKSAGVTTGAFYGYYSSKEELFAALVDEHYKYLLTKYKQSLSGFEELSPKRQTERMGSVGKECMQEMLVYMHSHRDEFHLILLCSDGTPYSTLTDDLVELEIKATNRYCDTLRGLGKTVPDIDERLEHILVTGMMNAYFEIIIHDMSMEDAEKYLCELNDFYTAGWLKIMGQ